MRAAVLTGEVGQFLEALFEFAAFLLALLAPASDGNAATCTYQKWVWGDGPYKLCFYDCAGKRVAKAVNTTEECPATIEKRD